MVEDYRSVGLSLRRHPVAFLRDELRARGMAACADLAAARGAAYAAAAAVNWPGGFHRGDIGGNPGSGATAAP